MEDDGQQFAYRKFIAPASGTVSFARALNRAVTGSTNELIVAAQMYLIEDDMAPREVGFKLNDFLLSASATEKSRRYGKSREAFKLLSNGNEPQVAVEW